MEMGGGLKDEEKKEEGEREREEVGESPEEVMRQSGCGATGRRVGQSQPRTWGCVT